MSDNPLRGKDPLPDPYVKGPLSPVNEETHGTRHPARFEPKQSTVGSTQPQQRMRAHAHHSTATQSIPSGAATDVIFDAPVYDTAGLLVANQFRIPTTGKITGAWLIHAHLTWEAAPAGSREVNILKNGTQIMSCHNLGSNDAQSQEIFTIENDPQPGDLYKVQAFQNSGGPLNLTTDDAHSHFEIIHLW